jgi:hypothetical protein
MQGHESKSQKWGQTCLRKQERWPNNEIGDWYNHQKIPHQVISPE